MVITTPVSVGELIDKITILQIKQQRICDSAKLQHINRELEQLLQTVQAHQLMSDTLTQLMTELKNVNEALWVIEDEIRACEKAKDFSDTFIQLARDVYFTNDKRAELKRQINETTGSALCEVKSYEDYT